MRLGRILVGVDGSKPALAACRVAASIARAAQAKLMLLYVPQALASRGPPGATLGREAWEGDERVLEEAAAAVGDDALVLGTKVLPERTSIVKAIVTYAEENDADLIVLGTRGLGGFRRLTLGSVSSGVAAHARMPVLVVRSGKTGQGPSLKSFVVATDGSANSEYAVQAAAQFSKLMGATLKALYVMHIPEIAYATGIPVPIAEMEEGVRLTGEGALQKAASLAVAAGIKATCEMRKGVSPAQAIIDYSEESNADIIVLGARGLGGFMRLLMGSVSNTVLHYSGCSVLVARKYPNLGP
jgi:nucleotide-binding universal stress UspA family protein